VVTEAVKASSPEGRINMALAAIESEKISENTAAERFGVPQRTLNDRRRKEVHASGSTSMQVPRETHYSDGRVVREVTDQERDEWAARHAEGKNFQSIAKEFGRDPRTVTAEIRKRQLLVPAPAQEASCPEALQRGQPVAPKTEPIVASAPAPINTPTGLLPELSVKLIAEEKKLATKRAAALVSRRTIGRRTVVRSYGSSKNSPMNNWLVLFSQSSVKPWACLLMPPTNSCCGRWILWLKLCRRRLEACFTSTDTQRSRRTDG
jgi:hypothetical protein